MLPERYVQDLFIIVNLILSVYIVFYAYVFLIRTKSYPDRKPWELLFIAANFFLVSAFLAVSGLYGVKRLFGAEIETLRRILEFFFSALILMAFITQSYLILKSDLIVISRKLKKTEPKPVTEQIKEEEEKKRRKQNKIIPEEEIKEEFREKEVKKEMEEEHFKPEIRDEEGLKKV